MISYTSDMKICQLRNEMKYEDISAYIVIDGDDHQVEIKKKLFANFHTWKSFLNCELKLFIF